jgi:cobalt-zinc-cadmium efflux system membrane fusion protein
VGEGSIFGGGVRSKLVGIGLSAAVAALSACGNGDAKTEPARPRLEQQRIIFPRDSSQIAAIVTVSVQAGGPQRVSLPGRLVWDETRTVRMFPALAGRVTAILAKVGDRVGKGKALAMLASPDFGQAQADARRAKTDFTLAQKNLERLRELFQAGVAPRKDLSTAEADYERAQAELHRAESRVSLYGTPGDSIVDQNLALTTPIAGIVVERNINPGQELRPDLQLSNAPAMFVVTDPAHLWVQLDATEDQLSSLARGKKIKLGTAAWPGEIFDATIEAISDFIDPATRTVKVRGSVANRGGKLKAEMFVTAETEGPPRAGLQVPARAIVQSGSSYYAYVEEGPGRYARVLVRVAGTQGGMAGILSGLSQGQKVVVEGNLLLDRLYGDLEAPQS